MSAKTITDLIALLQTDPQTQALVQSIAPYVPALQRNGMSFYEDVLKYAVQGQWAEADCVAWGKMTDEERDNLASSVLDEARNAVDREYEREQLAKEVALKIVISLLTSLL